jgi:hypothetical protein
METPSYFSVITADVRYDKELNSQQKLLFSEITTLTQATGECWASNAYFARLYEVDTRTIQRWIMKLKERGYISIQLIYKKGTKQVEKRIIRILIPPTTKVSPPHDNSVTTPHDKNVVDNNTSRNSTRDNNIEEEDIEVPKAIKKPQQGRANSSEVLASLKEDNPGKSSADLLLGMFFDLASETGSGMRRLNPMHIKRAIRDILIAGNVSADDVCHAIGYLFSEENFSQGQYAIILRRANQLTEDKVNQLLVYVDELKRKQPAKSVGGIEGAGRRL